MNARARETSVQYLIDAPLKGFSKVASTSLNSTVLGQWSDDIMFTYNTSNSLLVRQGAQIFYAVPGVEQVYFTRDDVGLLFLALCNNISDDNLDNLIEAGIAFDISHPEERILLDVRDRCGKSRLYKSAPEKYTLVERSITVSVSA